MHIPNEMLGGAVCQVTGVLAAGGVLFAAIAAVRSHKKPAPAYFANVTALIFAGQMVNFAVQNGTSGHLLGGVLAAGLLGVPFAVLALALVVSLQAVIFADGGLLVLGANVFNMALLGAGGGGVLRLWLLRTGWRALPALALTSWGSIMLAALACSLELAFSGTIAADRILPAMLGVHALIGLGEAGVSIVLLHLLVSLPVSEGRWRVAIPLLGAVLVAAVLGPFASSRPDGLEWVAQQYGFFKESAPLFVSPLADYAMPGVADPALATALAGLAGVMLIAWLAWMIGKIWQHSARVGRA